MKMDPIVDEIHQIREELSRESGHDLRRIAEAARKRQQASANTRTVVKSPPKRVVLVKKTS